MSKLIRPIVILEENKYSNSNYGPASAGYINPIYLVNEEWRDIPEYGKYMVSSYGRVYSKRNNHLMSAASNANGYLQVKLSRDDGNVISIPIHRLVALSFIHTEDTSLHINHKNAIRTDPRVSNLEWCTRSYNNQYAYDIGNNIRGEDHRFAIHSEDKIRDICGALQDGHNSEYIIDHVLGLTDRKEIFLMLKTIGYIRRREKWKGVSKDYIFPEYTHSNFTFTINEVHELCKLFEKGMSAMEAYNKLYPNIDEDIKKNEMQAVRRIRRRVSYPDIVSKYDF